MSSPSFKLNLEIFTTLLLAKFILILFPFKKISAYFYSKESATSDLSLEDKKNIKFLRKKIIQLSKKFPFEMTCYPQAIAGKIILNRRNLKSTLYIGIKKNETGEFEGHAWVRCSGLNVTGKQGYKDFKVITSYH